MAPGKSSVAVNNCIRQLSYHKHNLHDTAGIWGEVRGFYRRFDVDPFENAFNLSKVYSHKFRESYNSTVSVLVVIANQY